MSDLISGKEALIALANGQDVEYIGDTNVWFSLNKEISSWKVSEVLGSSDLMDGINYEFRLKPKTILLNGIEVPAPFEPKDGDDAWFISDDDSKGYSCVSFSENMVFTFGVWRSREEIKQVVAALRSIFNAK